MSAATNRASPHTRLLLRLVSAFTFAFWLLVGDFRNGASPWIPVIALASLEIGLFVSGLTGRNNGLLYSRVRGAGIEDFDLMTPVAQRMLLERAREHAAQDAERYLELSRILGPERSESEAEDEGTEVPTIDVAAAQRALSGWPVEPRAQGSWIIAGSEPLFWLVELGGVVFVVGWFASSTLQRLLPASLPLLVAALTAAGVAANLALGGAPSSLSLFRGRHLRLARALEFALVVTALAYLVYLLVRPTGWDALRPQQRAHAQQLFSQAASSIAGHSARVHCDYKHTGVVNEADGLAEVGGHNAYLTPAICFTLYDLALRHHAESTEQTSWALKVLGHEASHLAGSANEAVTECYALQRGVDLGIRFGLSRQKAEELMRFRLKMNSIDYESDPAYVVPSGCHHGGPLDLHLHSPLFP